MTTNLIAFVSVSLLALSTAVGCAAETASESNTAPTSEIASNAITTDDHGMGCMLINDSKTGAAHQACCQRSDETPYGKSSCGVTVAIGCDSPVNGCVYYSNDGQSLPCPMGMTCAECAQGDQAGTRFMCQ